MFLGIPLTDFRQPCSFACCPLNNLDFDPFEWSVREFSGVLQPLDRCDFQGVRSLMLVRMLTVQYVGASATLPPAVISLVPVLRHDRLAVNGQWFSP